MKQGETRVESPGPDRLPVRDKALMHRAARSLIGLPSAKLGVGFLVFVDVEMRVGKINWK